MAQQQTMQRKKSFAGGALAGAGAAAAAAGGRRFSAGGRRGSETGGRVRRPSMENALASFKEGRRRISLSGRNLKPELVAASQAVPGLACVGPRHPRAQCVHVAARRAERARGPRERELRLHAQPDRAGVSCECPDTAGRNLENTMR